MLTRMKQTSSLVFASNNQSSTPESSSHDHRAHISLQSRLNNGWPDAKLSQRHRLKLRNFFVVVHFSTLLALLRCLQASYFMRVLWANLTMHTHILSDHGRLVLHFVNDSNKSPTIYHIPPWLAEDSPIFANLTFQVHQASGCYVLLYVWVA